MTGRKKGTRQNWNFDWSMLQNCYTFPAIETKNYIVSSKKRGLLMFKYYYFQFFKPRFLEFNCQRRHCCNIVNIKSVLFQVFSRLLGAPLVSTYSTKINYPGEIWKFLALMGSSKESRSCNPKTWKSPRTIVSVHDLYPAELVKARTSRWKNFEIPQLDHRTF